MGGYYRFEEGKNRGVKKQMAVYSLNEPCFICNLKAEYKVYEELPFPLEFDYQRNRCKIHLKTSGLEMASAKWERHKSLMAKQGTFP